MHGHSEFIHFKIFIMESTEQETLLQSNFEFNDEIQRYLDYTSRWGKFLSILGFIGTGFILLGGIIFLIFGATISEFNATPEMPGWINSVVGFIYILSGVLYFFPCLYLYNFSEKISNSLDSNSQEDFNAGFKNLKSLFKFMGIMSIICIGLFILFFIGIIFTAIFIGM